VAKAMRHFPQPMIKERSAKIRLYAKRQLRAAMEAQRLMQQRGQKRMRAVARGTAWWLR